MYLENSHQPKIDVNSEYNEITLKTNTGNITISTEGKKIYRDSYPINDHEGNEIYHYYMVKKEKEDYDTYIGKSTIDYTLPREGTHSEGTHSESTHSESSPRESSPRESTYRESTHSESSPRESTYRERTHHESNPRESTYRERTHHESNPRERTRRKHRRGDYIKQMFSYGRVRRGGTRKSRRKSCKN